MCYVILQQIKLNAVMLCVRNIIIIIDQRKANRHIA